MMRKSLLVLFSVCCFLVMFNCSVSAYITVDFLDYPVPKEKYLPGSYNNRSFLHPPNHLGDDINPETPYKNFEGFPVEAIGNGKIVWYTSAGGYGELVAVIEHDFGKEVEFTNGKENTVKTKYILSIYGHIRKNKERGDEKPLTWQVGHKIERGQIIGYINDDAHNGDGKEHLHLGIRLSSQAVAQKRDPKWFRGYDEKDKKGKWKYRGDFAQPSHVIEKLRGPSILDGSIYPYPNTFSPGQVITFVYKINNPTAHNIPNVRLGAQIRKSQPQGVWIDDPSRDRVVTLQSGAHDYSRDFQIPSSATPGLYDAHWVILHHDTGVRIDSEQKTRILRITGPPTPPGQQAIRDAYKEIETAIENKDITKVMSYFSTGFLHNSQDRSSYQGQLQELADNYQNIQVKFTKLQITINENTATTTVHTKITADLNIDGITELFIDQDESTNWYNYWIKERGLWKIHGNQERVGVDVDTKYWEAGNYQLRIAAQASPGDVSSITITGPSYLDTATVNKPGDPVSPDNPKQLYDDGQHWDGQDNDGQWHVELNIDATPTTSDTITFHITYIHGSTETKQKTIDGVFTETATLVSPPDGSTVYTLTPTFKWQAPSISVFTYSVQISDTSFNRIYDKHRLPSNTTSYTIPSGPLSKEAQYYWLVSARDANGNEALTNWDTFTISGTAASTTRAIGQPKFGLSQNYPNPFNPQTTIEYDIEKDCDVTLKIYNLAGQLIKTLVDEYQTVGHYTITWYGDTDAGQEVASGVYFYRIKAGDKAAIKKMVVLK